MRQEYINKYLKDCINITNQIDQKQIESISIILQKIQQSGGRVFVIGVGGSAANASHFVNDLRKICGIEAYAPTDNVSELTARTNDNGWESVFVEWLKTSNLRRKDGVFVLSVGGGNVEKKVSVNIVEALEYANCIGAYIMGITSRDGGFTKKVADACVLIPIVNNSTVTPHAEAFQSVIWHLLVSSPELKKNEMKWESNK